MDIYLLNGGPIILPEVFKGLCVVAAIIGGLLLVGMLLYVLYTWLFPEWEETKGSQRTMLILLVAGIGVLIYFFGSILWSGILG